MKKETYIIIIPFGGHSEDLAINALQEIIQKTEYVGVVVTTSNATIERLRRNAIFKT